MGSKNMALLKTSIILSIENARGVLKREDAILYPNVLYWFVINVSNIELVDDIVSFKASFELKKEKVSSSETLCLDYNAEYDTDENRTKCAKAIIHDLLIRQEDMCNAFYSFLSTRFHNRVLNRNGFYNDRPSSDLSKNTLILRFNSNVIKYIGDDITDSISGLYNYSSIPESTRGAVSRTKLESIPTETEFVEHIHKILDKESGSEPKEYPIEMKLLVVKLEFTDSSDGDYFGLEFANYINITKDLIAKVFDDCNVFIKFHKLVGDNRDICYINANSIKSVEIDNEPIIVKVKYDHWLQ